LFLWKCVLLCVPQVCRRPSVLYLFYVSHVWSYACSSELPKAVPLYLCIYLSVWLESHGLWTEVCNGSTVTNKKMRNNPQQTSLPSPPHCMLKFCPNFPQSHPVWWTPAPTEACAWRLMSPIWPWAPCSTRTRLPRSTAHWGAPALPGWKMRPVPPQEVGLAWFAGLGEVFNYESFYFFG
jgi:hypothetical protein